MLQFSEKHIEVSKKMEALNKYFLDECAKLEERQKDEDAKQDVSTRELLERIEDRITKEVGEQAEEIDREHNYFSALFRKLEKKYGASKVRDSHAKALSANQPRSFPVGRSNATKHPRTRRMRFVYHGVL